MNENLVINIILVFVQVLMGLMFLEGIWHKKGKAIKSCLDIDNLFFSKSKDKRIFKSGDRLAFLICLIMAICTLINSILFLIFPNIPNISAIFIFVSIILTWPLRIFFLFLNKDKSYDEVVRIWPFPK
jgi:hypothetical protein